MKVQRGNCDVCLMTAARLAERLSDLGRVGVGYTYASFVLG